MREQPRIGGKAGFLERQQFLDAAKDGHFNRAERYTMLLLEVKTEGTEAIQSTARILRKCFRSNDLVARLAPRRFAVLVFHNHSRVPVFSERILATLAEEGAAGIEVEIATSTAHAEETADLKKSLHDLEERLSS